MLALKQISSTDGDNTNDETLFGLIAQDIETQGYSIRHGALPEGLAMDLFHYQQSLATEKF